MAREISHTDDLIDSREIIERIAELEAADLEAEAAFTVPGDWTPAEELAALKRLADEASAYSSDWEYGVTLIQDAYFVEYAQELARDIGAISDDLAWPASYIDWEAAARALQQEYTSVDFDGVTFWVR